MLNVPPNIIQPYALRIAWAEIPGPVRAALEARFGVAVSSATTQHGGFSPSAAVRLHLTDGRRVFIKAISEIRDPYTIPLYQREARVAELIPAWAPAPRLLFTQSQDGWLVLAFEDIDGILPAVPWQRDQVRQVLAAISRLGLHEDPALLDSFEPWHVAHPLEEWRGWAQLAREQDLDNLPPWVVGNFDRLMALEAQYPAASQGQALIHSDLRADNIMLRGEEVLFVDWAWATCGAPWIDLMIFCISGVIQGLGDPETVFGAHRLGQAAEPEAVLAMLAALAGRFTRASRQPVLPRIPTLRSFQAAEAYWTLQWLAQRTGWR